jgi:CubicO group peptidase (beta-lactamase class C family)
MRAKLTDERVEAALKRAMALGEIGVQVAAYVGEDLVIDTWLGNVDRAPTKPVDGTTLFSIFSVTKALTAACLHLQAERGLVDYAAPLARYWPEYAANGKDGITVRHVLTHRAGVPQMPEGITPELMADWEWVVDGLAKITPLWPPGTTNGYLSYSFGWLIGEVVRRTDPQRRSFDRFAREEVLEPLGIADLHLGLPAAEQARVAVLDARDFPIPAREAAPLFHLSMPAPVAPGTVFNRPDVQAASNPAAGAIADAASVARLFAMLACGGELAGVRLLSADRVRSFTRLREDWQTPDVVLGRVGTVGEGAYRLGSDRPDGEPVIGLSQNTLSHPGAGGSVGWADLDSGLAAAICHNRMFSIPRSAGADHPFDALGEALRAVALDHLVGAGRRHESAR